MACEVAARVYRGEVVEAQHCADIAVVDVGGNLTHYFGNPDAVYMTRSSVKPFQVLPLIRTGAFIRLGFSQEQLAIMCSSHNGTDRHREVVQSNLWQAGNHPEDLQCGCHLPMGMDLEGTYPNAGEDKDPLRHNCSGKHSGFLALAGFLGEKIADYLNPQSRTQQLAKEAVAEICQYPVEKIEVGIDGCSAPVFSLPLKNLAIGIKNLAIPQAKDAETRQALGLVKAAMTGHPYLISGDRRFDYDLMRSFPGNGISKIGAESIQAMGFSDPPVGLVVKITDGSGGRALGPVCVHALKQLGIIRRFEDHIHLLGYASPEVRNCRNLLTGRIVVDFQLKKV
ncbi:MAG: asparaginase [bacterium]|nr:asparaginase [bacterium]